MIYGTDDAGFYIEFKSKSHEVGNIRQEFELRAKQLYEKNDKIILSISGGLDSQIMLHSFLTQGLNVKTSFMHYGKYNDNELSHIKKLDEKYGIKTEIIVIDPTRYYQELKEQALKYDILSPYALLHGKYLSMIPEDYVFIQAQGPDLYSQMFTNKVTKQTYFAAGYYDNTVSRYRAFNIHKRKNESIFFPNFDEHLLSLMNDDVFSTSLCISDYWTDKKSQDSFETKTGTIKRDTIWDKYTKPFIFGKYWKNELMYFPKFAGLENLMYMFKDFGPGIISEDGQISFTYNEDIKKSIVMIPIKELYSVLNSNDNITKKYYLKYNEIN